MAQNTAHEIKLDSLLSIRDLSEYLGVPVKTLYDWRLKRTGPTPTKIGGRLRYRASVVQMWIERHTGD